MAVALYLLWEQKYTLIHIADIITDDDLKTTKELPIVNA